MSNKQVKLTPEELRYMALLHELTGVHVRDCIIDDEFNRIIFVVNPSEVGQAIGPRGINVQRLRKILGRNIEIVGYSEKLEEMIRFVLIPARVRDVRIVTRGGKKTIYVSVEPSDKGIAIGKNGKNVARARLLLGRYFGIDNVVIA
ncbi:MAG: NusA-like transcription termination signal-binding factor [Desulfurococcales archaeon]|nr:NusA-like transcription termination signal-binding factor [Desulfurococcales archaeon]